VIRRQRRRPLERRAIGLPFGGHAQHDVAARHAAHVEPAVARLRELDAHVVVGGVRAPGGHLGVAVLRRRPGQPLEGVGWELAAIASVVVGGTLLTGGMGSVPATVAGALLFGLVFNLLNFENGKGIISLSAHWQSVIRGAFLLIVILLQVRLARPQASKA